MKGKVAIRNSIVWLAVVCLMIQISALTLSAFAEELQKPSSNAEDTLSDYLKGIIDTSNIQEVVEEVPGEDESVVAVPKARKARAKASSTPQTKDTTTVGENELVVNLNDNTSAAYVFDENIKYSDENGTHYKEVSIINQTDDSLREKGFEYTNGQNNVRMNFSSDYTKGVRFTESNGTTYTLIPVKDEDNDLKIVGKKTKAKSETGDVDVFEYENIFGEGTVLRYVPQLNNCKEEIVLPKYDGKNTFAFHLNVGKNTASVNSNNEVVIQNADGETLVTLQPTFAYDSFEGVFSEDENHYTENCKYVLKEESEGKYLLTIEVPEKFLTNSEIVYPVTIDPTTSQIEHSWDTCVYSGNTSLSSGTNNQMMFGRTTDLGKARALVKFNVPSAIKSGATINSASYWARELTGRTTSTYVRPYIITGSWNNNTTWSNKPSYDGNTGMTRKNINSNSSDGGANQYWYKFELKSAVKKWVDGTVANHGIMFVSEEEGLTDYKARAFSTKEYPTSSMRGYVVINYTNDATPPTITSVTGNSSSWTKESLTLTINGASDGTGSGLHSTPYSFDGGSTWQTSNKKSFSSNQTVKIRVKDKMGNIYSHKDVNIIRIDKTAPTVKSVTGNIGTWTKGSQTLTINGAADAGSGLHATPYSFDGGSTWQTSNQKSFSKNQTVKIRVRDKLGNTYTYHDVELTKIDKTAPTVISVTGNPTSWTKNNVTLKVNGAADTPSGLHASPYSFDNGATWQAANEKAFSSNQTVKVKVRDKAGNAYAHTSISISKIDKAKPTVTQVKTETVENGATKITVVGAKDTGSGLHDSAYSFDAGTTWQTANSKTIESQNGDQIVKIRVRDKVGNTYSYKDLNIAATEVVPSIPPAVYENNGNIYIRDDNTDGLNTVEYFVGDNVPNSDDDWTIYEDPFTPERVNGGRVYARVRNSAGVSSVAVYELSRIGVYATNKQDLIFGSKSLPFEFTRNYSSDDDVWYFAFETSLKPFKQQVIKQDGNTEDVENNNILVFTNPQGEKKYYSKTSNNEYTYALYASDADKETEEEASKELVKVDNDKYTLTNNDVTYEFDQSGRLNKASDKEGHAAVFNFTENNGEIQGLTITDEMNRQYALTYENGRPTSLTDPANRNVTYGWDNGKLTSFKNARDYTENYNYDNNGNLTQDDGTAIEYDQNERITKKTERDRSYLQFAYNDNDKIVIATDSKNRSITYDYDETMNLKTVVDVDGKEVSFTYDPEGRLATEISEEEKIEYEYENNENISKKTTTDLSEDDTEETVVTNYIDLDEPSEKVVGSISDTDGNTEEFEYAAGQVVKKTETFVDDGNEESETTNYEYDSNGKILSTTTTTTKTTEDGITDQTTIIYEYDSYGYKSKEVEIDLLSNDTPFSMTEYINDPVGNVLSKKKRTGTCEINGKTYSYNFDNVDPIVSEYEYNSMCEKTKESYKAGIDDGIINTYEYNQFGSITNQTVDGEVTVNQYENETNRLESQTVSGITTTFEYDNNGNLISDRFDIYQTEYNILNSITNVNAGDRNLITYSYDESMDQNLTEESYANHQKVDYFYQDGNMTGIKFSDDDSNRYTKTYDNQGNLISQTDNINKTISENKNDNIYVYQLTNSGKGDLIYQIEKDSDDSGEASKVETTIESNKFVQMFNGRDLRLLLPTHKTLEKTQTQSDSGDDLSKTVKIDDDILFSVEKTCNSDGFVTKVDEQVASDTIKQQYKYHDDNITEYTRKDKTTQYVYDTKGQLVRVNDENNGKTWVYDYNDRGNLTNQKEYSYSTSSDLPDSPNFTLQYEYNDETWPDLLTRYDNNSIVYDAVGNPTTYLGWNFVWEGGRQLKEISDNTGKTISYKYNADGLRTCKTVDNESTKYFYNNSDIIYQKSNEHELFFLYDQSEIIGVQIDGETYVYLKNEMNEIIALVDETGSIVVEYKYDPWGQVLDISGSKAETIGHLNPILYKDYYYDFETEFYYLQSRYYNPAVGRFLNADDCSVLSIEQNNHLQYSLFIYCLNNPIMGEDPDGMYDRNKARAYAEKWHRYRNTYYPNYDKRGGDCTNFTSQCLFAGGLKRDNTWYCYRTNHYSPFRFNASTAWVNANEQYKHLTRKGKQLYYKNAKVYRYTITDNFGDVKNWKIKRKNRIQNFFDKKYKKIKVGDIAYFRYDEDSSKKEHSAFVRKVSKKNCSLAQHGGKNSITDLTETNRWVSVTFVCIRPC